jgi:hypothetical protein
MSDTKGTIGQTHPTTMQAASPFPQGFIKVDVVQSPGVPQVPGPTGQQWLTVADRSQSRDQPLSSAVSIAEDSSPVAGPSMIPT